jgi:ArsR family transcriptional regulator
LVAVFKALSDETRLRIIKLLEKGELCVCDIMAALDMIQSKVSFHMNVLKEAGLIRDRREGRWIHYRIDGADIRRRFLLQTVLEGVSAEAVREDGKRLEAFLNGKTAKGNIVPIRSKEKRCCGA